MRNKDESNNGAQTSGLCEWLDSDAIKGNEDNKRRVRFGRKVEQRRGGSKCRWGPVEFEMKVEMSNKQSQ